jgi:hypothetical protein
VTGVVIVSPRVLTNDERTFVERLLSIGGLSSSSFALQVESLRVVSRCDCGCPTVDFISVDAGDAKAGRPGILVDAYARTRDGDVVGAILWEKDGNLSGLELYSMAADPKELPDPGTLSFDAL